VIPLVAVFWLWGDQPLDTSGRSVQRLAGRADEGNVLAKLRIPEQYQAGFDKLVALNSAQVDALIAGLESQPVGITAAKAAPVLAPALTPLSVNEVREIVEFVISFYVVRSAYDTTPEQFVVSLAEAIQAARDKTKSKDHGALSRDRLDKLLNIESIRITSKATALLTDHDHVFCTARIYTDVRHVFQTPDNRPVGAVIFHTLKLTYFGRDGRHDNFYLALDSSDIGDLRDVLNRADLKEKTLRSELEVTGIRCLNPEKDASS